MTAIYQREKIRTKSPTANKPLVFMGQKLQSKHIKTYEDIISNLPKFLEFIRGEKGMLFEDLKNSGYQILVKHIGEKHHK